jgi:hypothetical protein
LETVPFIVENAGQILSWRAKFFDAKGFIAMKKNVRNLVTKKFLGKKDDYNLSERRAQQQ